MTNAAWERPEDTPRVILRSVLPKSLGRRHAARVLGISPRTLDRWRDRGDIKPMTNAAGRRVWPLAYATDDVLALLPDTDAS